MRLRTVALARSWCTRPTWVREGSQLTVGVRGAIRTIIVETERLILRHFHAFDGEAMDRLFVCPLDKAADDNSPIDFLLGVASNCCNRSEHIA